MCLFFVVSYMTSLKHQSRKRNAAVNEPALFAYDSITVSYEGVEISIYALLTGEWIRYLPVLGLCTVPTSGSVPSSVPG